MMVIGLMMMLIPCWNLISEAANVSSLIFYNTDIEIDQMQFMINGKLMTLPKLGDEFATLTIPSVHLETSILQGEGSSQLRQGVGHYVGSLLPGEGGNVVLSGHRETAFYLLKDVQVGDQVFVETDYGRYEYQISEIYITTPDDITPTLPTESEKLTMYTCYPFIKWGASPERYVVVADFVQLK